MRGVVLLRVHERLLAKLITVVERVLWLVAFVEIIVTIVSRPVQIVVPVLIVQVVFNLSRLVVLDHIRLTAAHHRVAFVHRLILRSQLIHSSINRI